MKSDRLKKAFKIMALIICIAVAAAAICFVYIFVRMNTCKANTSPYSYESVYDVPEIKFQTDSDGVFRVIKINDTHFINGKCDNDKKTLSVIESVLDKTPCDLIVVDGDLVEGFNLNRSYDKFGAIDTFAQLAEKYEVPWTFAPGNNDCEIDGRNEDIIAFMMRYEHFLCKNERGIDGSVQFFADIYCDNELVHSIAIMDSGTRKPRVVGGYQPMSKNQAHWLNDNVKQKGVRTSVFFHMPTNGFKAAYDNGESVEGIERYETFPYAEKLRDGAFDEIIDGNDLITLISCGHQHSNNMCSFYNGRYYQLSSAGGYGALRNDFIIPSLTLTVINTLEENPEYMYHIEQIME